MQYRVGDFKILSCAAKLQQQRCTLDLKWALAQVWRGENGKLNLDQIANKKRVKQKVAIAQIRPWQIKSFLSGVHLYSTVMDKEN